MSGKQKVIKIGIPIAIVVFGFLVMRIMVLTKTAPEKITKIDTGVLVELLSVTPAKRQIKVLGTGTVQPTQEISIVPQVKGLINYVAPQFVAGGFFQKDELMFAIESIDYELAVERARAGLAKAELELASIEGKAKIARLEWEQLKNDDTEPNPLVLYEPQLKDAVSNRDAAFATLRQAEIDLARTEIRAPFNCRIRSKQIDIGQYVKDGNSVAVIAGTDTAEIIVPLPFTDIAWLDIPNQDNGKNGSKVTASFDVAGNSYAWAGRLVRSLGEVDPLGRMARIVVAVDNPYGRLNGDPGKPDLAAGMFVIVEIHGKILSDVYAVPREALREFSTVWIMDESGKLQIRKVTVVREERDEVLITQGLHGGDQVVLTNLAGAAKGMLLRTAGEKLP